MVYLDNTKHFIFWLCNMKPLNFRHFNTSITKFYEIVFFFFQKEAKTAPKRPISFCLVYRKFWPFYEYSGLFQKISEGCRTFPKTVEHFRRL